MKPAVMFAMMLMLLFPLFVWAVEWESIARQGDQEILVDLDSYDEHGAYSSIMAKVISHPPKSAVVTQQMELEFDCSQQRYRQHQAAAKQSAPPAVREFKPVSQDAQAKTVSGLVCQVRRMLNPQG